MEIVFIGKNPAGFREVLEIPIITKVGEVTKETTDEEFQTITGETLNLIGGEGLRTFSFSSFFPGKPYHFIEPHKLRPLSEYIRFFEFYQKQKEPLRVILFDGLSLVLNMACRVSLTYTPRDRAGDVPYTLDVKEYRRPNGRWFDAV